ncbi:MAG: RNA pyrophosphohydrolase [Gammaproteobacteria bacterium]|nr:RNA pyrophosphohydrolase [Gammaproteobacteria bacterium]MDJ0872508.1 RNA pyrophosphohydrolase [Gammaproteobacteria bacterium]MDJ0892046.1 RNA pyrophosphohydrolase [Gammaproteobacteria bacterium]
MIDSDGYRANVGIIIRNERGRVFWAKRVGQEAWQFPQGGIKPDESPREALFRELYEEVGLGPEHVEVTGWTRGWLRYRLPNRYVRRNCTPLCIGQKQIWYMLRFLGNEADFELDRGRKPEFERWRWVSYWHPIHEVVFFKRGVYRRALRELAPLVFPEGRRRQSYRRYQQRWHG